MCVNVNAFYKYKTVYIYTMKKLLALIAFCFCTSIVFAQNETERIFLFKSGKEFFVRVEIPYYTDLATPDNKIVVEVPGYKIKHVVDLADMKAHQSQNELTDYVAVYDFPIGKNNIFRLKSLKCRVSFDYVEMEEFFSLEFRKFVWL